MYFYYTVQRVKKSVFLPFIMHSPQISIVRRRVDIHFERLNGRPWLALNNGIEDFLNAMSYYFAPSETFFIQSVQNFQNQITDPALKNAVSNFIYQEAMHTTQHNKCNHVLTHTHPHGPLIAKLVGSIFSFIRRFSPKSTQLAFTAALEHFYAILSDFLLTHQKEFIEISDPAFSALWLWHAVEETEHKAVCFDVYHHIYPKGPISYLNRMFAMLLGTIFFALTLPIALSMIKRGAVQRRPAPHIIWSRVTSAGTNEKFKRYGFWRFLKQSFSLRAYFSYYKPSFHPWEHDNSHLIEEWRRTFPEMSNSNTNKSFANLSAPLPSP